MKTLFWVLVVAAVGWAFFMAANASRLGSGSAEVPSGTSVTTGLSKESITEMVKTNAFQEAGKKFTHLSTNAVENIKNIDVTRYVEGDKLDEAGLALQSFAFKMTGLWSRLSKDGWIISSMRARLVQKFGPQMYKIKIDSEEGNVALSGVVPTSDIRSSIIDTAESTQWVDSVDSSRLTVAVAP